MTKQAAESLDAYYAEAGSWAHDRQDALRASRRIAWIVAVAAVVVAVCEALALLFLTPLKTVVPYTLMVDKQTGFVQALEPLDAQRISADAALTQSFLVQYVIGREGYDVDSLNGDYGDYTKVYEWSGGTARSEYYALMHAPDSPVTRYPRSTVVEVRVRSVSSVAPHVSMVRYETQRHDAGGQAAPSMPWVALIHYDYSGKPMTQQDRLINPLGFQVTRYRRSPEALPVVEPTPQVSPDPGQPPMPVRPASPRLP